MRSDASRQQSTPGYLVVVVLEAVKRITYPPHRPVVTSTLVFVAEEHVKEYDAGGIYQ
jgi:hypothetical protein